MFIFVMAIAFAANRAEDAKVSAASQMAGRGPASLAAAKSKKPPIPSPEKAPAHKHTHKLSGPLNSSIELVGTAPAAGDIFVLKGVVVSASPSENVEFKWLLPEGVELVNGEASGEIASLTPDKPFEVQVTLRHVSDSNERVHLQVNGAAGTQKFGNTAQYNTLTEKLLESSRKELLKSTEEHAAKHEQKIHH